MRPPARSDPRAAGRRRAARRWRAGRPRERARSTRGARRRRTPRPCSRPPACFPNQILTAYGIAPLQAGGLQGQGSRVAILGEAPTPVNDVTAYRNCFGFQGTALQIHGGSSIAPILESSLDAMTVSMVAPKLARLDLWVQAARGRATRRAPSSCWPQPLQATTNGTPLPNVISISYGVCEATVAPYTAARTLFDRQLAATAALGITTSSRPATAARRRARTACPPPS